MSDTDKNARDVRNVLNTHPHRLGRIRALRALDALAIELEAAETQRDALRGHVIWLLDYIGVESHNYDEMEELGAPSGIVAACAALAEVTPPEAKPPKICDQRGCERLATRRVDTNYGYLGDVCDDHYAKLLALTAPPEEPQP